MFRQDNLNIAEYRSYYEKKYVVDFTVWVNFDEFTSVSCFVYLVAHVHVQ